MSIITIRRVVLRAGLLLIALAVLTTACNLPSGTSPASAPTTPTPLKRETATATTQQPSLPPPTSTATPAPTATEAPSPTPTSPVLQSDYRGFIVYDRLEEMVYGYDLGGNPLNIKIRISGAEWIGFNEGQWANNSIYYVKSDDKAIVQIANFGAAQELNFIPAEDGLTFTISPDGQKIAWSFDQYSGTTPASELWVANIDGSDAKNIASIKAATNTKWMVLHPYRWLADGRLLYIDAPTGIGGYILFNGFAGIHVYDPSNNKLTNLTPGVGAGGLCLHEISPDLKEVISSCADQQPGTLSYVQLVDNQTVTITRQSDQNQAGSPVWSPKGDILAFAYARGDGINELGTVAFVPNGGTTPRILGTVQKGFYNVAAWVNDNQFLVQRYEDSLSSVWLFNVDGSEPVKLADGVFVSLIP